MSYYCNFFKKNYINQFIFWPTFLTTYHHRVKFSWPKKCKIRLVFQSMVQFGAKMCDFELFFPFFAQININQHINHILTHKFRCFWPKKCRIRLVFHSIPQSRSNKTFILLYRNSGKKLINPDSWTIWIPLVWRHLELAFYPLMRKCVIWSYSWAIRE